jgi:putative acetyltransferase
MRAGFGFNHQIAAPYRLQYPDAWMAQELTPEILASAVGTARCVSSLRNPVYW